MGMLCCWGKWKPPEHGCFSVYCTVPLFVNTRHEDVLVLPSLGIFGWPMGSGAVSYGQWCLPVSGSGLAIVTVVGGAGS